MTTRKDSEMANQKSERPYEDIIKKKMRLFQSEMIDYSITPDSQAADTIFREIDEELRDNYEYHLRSLYTKEQATNLWHYDDMGPLSQAEKAQLPWRLFTVNSSKSSARRQPVTVGNVDHEDILQTVDQKLERLLSRPPGAPSTPNVSQPASLPGSVNMGDVGNADASEAGQTQPTKHYFNPGSKESPDAKNSLLRSTTDLKDPIDFNKFFAPLPITPRRHHHMGISDKQTWASAPSLDQPEADTSIVPRSLNPTHVLPNESNATVDFIYDQSGDGPGAPPPIPLKSPERLYFIQNGAYNSLRSLRQSDAAPLQEETNATRHEASRALQKDSPESQRYPEDVAQRIGYTDPNRASIITLECGLYLQSATTSLISPTAKLNSNNPLQQLLSRRPRQKSPHPPLSPINEEDAPFRATRNEIFDEFHKHALRIMTRYREDLERIRQKNYESNEEWKRDIEHLDMKMTMAIKAAKRETKYDYVNDEEAVRHARRLAVGSATTGDSESVKMETGTATLSGGGLWKRTKKATETVTRFALAIPEDPNMKSCTSGSASGTATATKTMAAAPPPVPKIWPKPMDIVIPTKPPPPPPLPVRGNVPGGQLPSQAAQDGDGSDDKTEVGTIWPRQSEFEGESRKG
ncbi:hypothetical protein BCR34DRAFT_589349 [Clohesyomyces aquaticus]|uniref:Uncharacterized protein n=1 Tax=Clohesyomyces aquaticus TaxID=1231657 RepID=A0A1Y1ZHS7_9PLEO|nr:hypothetical protein BCR34DRAFT_589349 [Clohesyomyces aquaticus]